MRLRENVVLSKRLMTAGRNTMWLRKRHAVALPSNSLNRGLRASWTLLKHCSEW